MAKITGLSAKQQNKYWPEPNPNARRQRIKAGELRQVVRKDNAKRNSAKAAAK